MTRRVFIVSLWCIVFVALCSGLYADDYAVRFYDDSDGLSHWHISQITQDTTGMIWVATWNGLNRFDGQHFVSFKPGMNDSLCVPNDRIRRFRLTEENNLECLIEEHVYLFDTRTCRFSNMPDSLEREAYAKLKQRFNPDFDRGTAGKQKQFGSVQLENIWEKEYTDIQGNMWLYDDHGIYVVTPLPQRGRTINSLEVRSMTRCHNGDIWASVRDQKQVVVYDSTFQLKGYLDPEGRMHKQPVSFGNTVYCIRETRKGDKLFGCKPGYLTRWSADGKKTIDRDLRNVYDIQEDKKGRLWVATFGFGLWREQEDGRFERIPGTEGMKIRRLLFVEDGMLFAATTDGVLQIDHDRLTLHQREAGNPHSLSSNAIMCLYLFDGHLYAGTEGGGLNRLISDIHAPKWAWEHWTAEDGLESDIIFEMQAWSENEMLLQCSSSLSLFDVKTTRFVNYGQSFFRGNISGKLMFGEVPPILLNDSRLLVAPTQGMLVLDKDRLHTDAMPVRIALCSIRRNGEENYAVDDLDHITLAPTERNLVMRFATLDYRNDGQLLYSTRLYQEGKTHVDWSTPTGMSEVIMQDMQPGKYVFEIRSTNAFGHWQDNTRRIYIHVQPTFLESTLGKVTIVGLILLIALAITVAYLQVRFSQKSRTETLKAYLELQERLSQMEQHDRQNAPLPIPEILAPGYTSENERFLNALHRFMDEHIGDSDMTLDDLAKEVSMSRSTLSRKMHELFNLSAKDFVQAARIKHACSLLCTTDMPTKEVAYACGYSDPNYFSKCFKTNIGQTPTDYRDAHKENSSAEMRM